MPKITDEPLVRVCHIIFKRDNERLAKIAAASGKGKNHVVRAMLHTLLNQIEAQQNAAIDFQEGSGNGNQSHVVAKPDESGREPVLHSSTDA